VADRGCGAGVEPGHRRQTGSSTGVAHAYVGLEGGAHVGIGVGPGWSSGAGSSDGGQVIEQAGAGRRDGEEQPTSATGWPGRRVLSDRMGRSSPRRCRGEIWPGLPRALSGC
jgi:hypothetical protein